MKALFVVLSEYYSWESNSYYKLSGEDFKEISSMVLCVQNVPHSLMPLNNYSKLVKLFGEILETLWQVETQWMKSAFAVAFEKYILSLLPLPAQFVCSLHVLLSWDISPYWASCHVPHSTNHYETLSGTKYQNSFFCKSLMAFVLYRKER